MIDDILLDDINEHFDGLNQANSECSHLVADAPPNVYWANTYFFAGDFAVKVML